jgi:hypothetical protein
MRSWIRFRLVAGICLLAFSALAFSYQRVERNSFLSTAAPTVSALIQEVRSDKVVADRYERHFGMTYEEVLRFFATLHLAKLNSDSVYMVYLVDDQGVIKAHPQKLKAGTRVFANAEGTPVLLAKCGNAMIPGSNALTAVILPSVAESSVVLRDLSLTTPVADEIDTKSPLFTPNQPAAILPEMPPTITTGGRELVSVPALLAAIGGAGSVLIGSGHGTPVPEPASFIVVGSALVLVGLRRKSRK